MKHLALIFGCILLITFSILSLGTGNVTDARPYMAATIVLISITLDKLINEYTTKN